MPTASSVRTVADVDRPGALIQIQQAAETRREVSPRTSAFLHDLVAELKASGFVAESLRRSGQTSARVAPPA